jgi:hypothetical protein
MPVFLIFLCGLATMATSGWVAVNGRAEHGFYAMIGGAVGFVLMVVAILAALLIVALT